MATPATAWNQLITRPFYFLSTKNLEISGLGGQFVAGNYPCTFSHDPSNSGAKRKFGIMVLPTWRIQVAPVGAPPEANSYLIPQVCFYVPMFDATKSDSPVQTSAAVSAGAEVIVTGQLNGCTFAVCGAGAALSVAHIRPAGLGDNEKQKKAAMGDIIRANMPEQPTMVESSTGNRVTIIGIKHNGSFRFYAQKKTKVNATGPIMLAGITKF
jgi:hypothetical protein